MKTSLLASALLLLTGLVPASALELKLSTERLTPTSTLELRFDTSMIDLPKVGSIADPPPLITEPALKGEFKWTSTRSGNFHFTEPPPLGGTIAFTTRDGIADLEGKAITKTSLGSLRVEAFRVLSTGRTDRNGKGADQRRGRLLALFNDDVNLDAISHHLAFFSAKSHDFALATARLAKGKELTQFHTRNWDYLTPAANWKAQFAGQFTPPKPEETCANAIIIESLDPLPPGDDWTLKLTRETPNAAGTATLEEDHIVTWGSIADFQVQEISAETHFDAAHEIVVAFNKSIASTGKSAEDAARMAAFVKVVPQPAGLVYELAGNALRLTGAYEIGGTYDVTVTSGVPSDDGLLLKTDKSQKFTFQPSQAFVSTPAFETSQLATGDGVFDIYAANFKELHIRVKQLGEGELVKARELYRESDRQPRYDRHGDRINSDHGLAFNDFPGELIYDKSIPNTKPLEKATQLNLKWRDVLGSTPAAPLFIEIEAPPQDGAPKGTVINRAIVEFTDIGLVVKDTERDMFIYAFSLRTGQPMTDVEFTLMDEDRGYLRNTRSNASGVATTSGRQAHWVLARKGADGTALERGSEEGGISVWRHGLRYAWNSPWKDRLQTFLFSDRPVYKPGETAHVKAITRTRFGDDLKMPVESLKAQLNVTDPRGRTVRTQAITFSTNGTWSGDIAFPTSPVGQYSIRLNFGKNGDSDNDDYDGSSRWGHQGNTAWLSLRVDDFKPNTFEVFVEGDHYNLAKDKITVPMHANYYMGKALSSAKLVWNASLDQDYTPPQGYEDFAFGPAARWWHYGEERDEEGAYVERESHTQSWSANGEQSLADNGTAVIELPPPPPHKAALPQRVTVAAEVTDVNQQTIAASSELLLPGAEFIIGLHKTQWYGQAGQPMAVDLATITPNGKAFDKASTVELKVERQEWTTVKVEGAGGDTTTKNQMRLIEELKTNLQTQAASGAEKTLTPWSFVPKASGTYFLTATAKDSKGVTVFSQLAFYVLGNDGYPWAWEPGDTMDLQPEKTTVKAGDNLSIVVKTPISGTALVTVERNRVHRHYLQPLSPENPVVKVPFSEEDAPNAYISVLVIRGSAGSQDKHPMPSYKLGYCEIKVASQARHLTVETSPVTNPVLPGAKQTIAATVRDNQGQPVEGSEVVLYAVDEGVLSLMGYTTPQPSEFFHATMPLAVRTGTSINRLLTEDLDHRDHGNKGTILGDGGGDSGDIALRKNFIATALWSPSLITDKQGRVTATFTAPDSLTRYRIMAVAVKGADRFGSAESSFTINKPLMLEPVVPRFAHVGDEVLVKAVLHNTTKFSGEVSLELRLNENASFVREPGPYAMAALKAITPAADPHVDRRVVTLKAGESTAFAFPVRFVQHGTCVWQWRASTGRWSDATPLSDAVQSTFEVSHPAPVLREVHYMELSSATAADDLLHLVSPQLRESNGEIRVDFCRSRLGEARDALEYLLHYPYGCVEQTTSSTLPWIALNQYEALFPDLLEKQKVKDAIQHGADRLLTMQTDSGGLAYWPGGREPLLWASAYGGYGLIKARRAGATIPDDAMNKLTTWISQELRDKNLGSTQDSYHLYETPLALYVLALSGKAEPSYQNILWQRRDNLPEISRLFLGLAMSESGEKPERVSELLTPPTSLNTWQRYWLGDQTLHGVRMMLQSKLGRLDDAAHNADRIFSQRGLDGHWGTTFSNCWILLGLTATENVAAQAEPLQFQLTFGSKKEDIGLQTSLSASSTSYRFDRQSGSQPLHAAIPQGKRLRARVEVKAWPDLKTFQPVEKGFGITRRYERLTQKGELEPAKEMRVGDLIVVTLGITVHQGDRYLALEDPLPSVFEPVNPAFKTQLQRQDAQAEDRSWFCDFRELRDDKALFFTNSWFRTGTFELKYLARVIAEGDVIAPPTRIEAMYDPEHYGLGSIEHIQTLPLMNNGKVAGK